MIKNKTENGNILFLILIAVALFAGLSYVITQSSRSGSGDASREKAKLAASQILSHAALLQAGVMRISIAGCIPTQLSFESMNDTLHINPAAPTDKRCHIFSPTGGGVIAMTGDPNWSNDPKYYYSGSSAITGIGTTCADSSCADLLISLRGVSEILCEQLNKANGWDVRFNNIPTDTAAGCPFKGTFDCNGNNTVQIIASDPILAGRNGYCYRDTVYGATYNHVVMER